MCGRTTEPPNDLSRCIKQRVGTTNQNTRFIGIAIIRDGEPLKKLPDATFIQKRWPFVRCQVMSDISRVLHGEFKLRWYPCTLRLSEFLVPWFSDAVFGDLPGKILLWHFWKLRSSFSTNSYLDKIPLFPLGCTVLSHCIVTSLKQKNIYCTHNRWNMLTEIVHTAGKCVGATCPVHPCVSWHSHASIDTRSVTQRDSILLCEVLNVLLGFLYIEVLCYHSPRYLINLHTCASRLGSLKSTVFLLRSTSLFHAFLEHLQTKHSWSWWSSI